MTGRELFWRLLAVGSLAVAGLSAHYAGDARADLRRMEDEVGVLVTDCRERGACHYPMGAP